MGLQKFYFLNPPKALAFTVTVCTVLCDQNYVC